MSLRRPTYAPAVATDRGWVHTETGELLVSHSNLLSKLSDLGLDEFGAVKKKSAPKTASAKPKAKAKKSASKKASDEE